MISNLETADALREHADVVVIGGGTVGLVVSVLLARRGISVICLESGGMQQEANQHPYNEVEHTRSCYAGAAEGRFRCLGGTSTRWGGALIPFQAADMETVGWPLAYAELAAYVGQVEKFFGLDGSSYECDELTPDQLGDWVTRMAKWPPFRNRNVFNLLAAEAASIDGLRVWINATVCEFRVADSKLQSVCAKTPDGSSLEVTASTFVVAAGAIETTRLALLMDRQNGNVVSACSPVLGKGFHDHLSAPVADLVLKDGNRCNRLLGFRFGRSGRMRNLRFELAAATTLRERLPACFAQLSFEANEGGFAALREILRRLQRRKLPTMALLARIVADTPWILRCLWWRIVEKRLLFPANSLLMINMVIEQKSVQENRIGLSNNQVDCFGQPLACIDWNVTEADRHSIIAAAREFFAMWNASPLLEVASLRMRPESQIDAALVAGGGIYHPGGTTRIGATAVDGVVDTDLRLFAIPNVRLLSTSVLPTGGGANPTMMLMMLGFRLADDMTRPR